MRPEPPKKFELIGSHKPLERNFEDESNKVTRAPVLGEGSFGLRKVDVGIGLNPAGKPFEFRERLWHEPPELDYSKYELYDEVQKEFKIMGSSNEVLHWRTTWLDTRTEHHLLTDYNSWAYECSKSRGRESEEKQAFFRQLAGDIAIDLWESKNDYNIPFRIAWEAIIVFDKVSNRTSVTRTAGQ